MSQSVLLTTDFSELAQNATPHAIRLARALGCPIRLLHTSDLVAEILPGPIPATDDWMLELRGVKEEALERAAEAIAESGVEVTVHHRIGIPAQEILAEAADFARVVVMATHGYGGFRKLLLGSLTTKIVRAVRRPILVIPPDAPDRDVVRVLHPTDFSEVETGAYAEVLSFTGAYGAHLELFHVRDPRRGAESTPDESLAMLVSLAEEAGITASATTRDTRVKRAATAIAERAVGCDADLIMMPSHGRSGFDRLMLGSVTEELIRQAPRPVLVLKPPRLARTQGVP